MKFSSIALSLALFTGLGVHAAQAVGCVSGGAVGAVGGHMAGHHAVLGAVGGCIAGHEMNKHNKEKAKEMQMQNNQMHNSN